VDRPIVEFSCAIKSFTSSPALTGLSFSIGRGECYVLLGRNGAGKTTAMRCLIGLTTVDYGSVRAFDVDPREKPLEVRRRTAYLPDDPLLYEHLTIVEFLEYVSVLWNVPPGAARAKANELIAWLELTPHQSKLTRDLSRGMKQKLALAGALLHTPDLIVLDEPLTGVDLVSARHIKDCLKSLQKRGVTIVLATHMMDLAEEMADRIGIIHAGKIITEGTPQEIAGSGVGPRSLESAVLAIVK